VTAHYTGINEAVFADENTSISIGYLGELYIDFGIEGALLAAFLIGLAFGRCYRTIRDHSRSPSFVNYALCMMFALGFTSFGTALVKLIGGLLMTWAAALVLQRLVWPVLLSSEYLRPSGHRILGRQTKA
jgi:O-antigen ligase